MQPQNKIKRRITVVRMMTILAVSVVLVTGSGFPTTELRAQQPYVTAVTGPYQDKAMFHFSFVARSSELLMQYGTNVVQGQQLDAWAKRVAGYGAGIDSLVVNAFYSPTDTDRGVGSAELAGARIVAVRDYVMRSLEHNGLGGVLVRANILSAKGTDEIDQEGELGELGELGDEYEKLRRVDFVLYLNGSGGIGGGGSNVGIGGGGGNVGINNNKSEVLSAGLQDKQLMAIMTNPYPVWMPNVTRVYAGHGGAVAAAKISRQQQQQQQQQYTQQQIPHRPQQQQYTQPQYTQQPSYVAKQARPAKSVGLVRKQRVYDPVNQVFAIKTNLPYWLAFAPNAGIEFYMGHLSIALEGTLTYWEKKNDIGDKGIYVAEGGAEFRYWLNSDRTQGSHFFGVYGQAGEFDVKMNETGRQGTGFGGGLSYGYYLPVGNRWAFEFGIGVGALKLKYDIYEWNEAIGKNLWVKEKNQTWIGPTKVKAAVIFRIGNKN